MAKSKNHTKCVSRRTLHRTLAIRAQQRRLLSGRAVSSSKQAASCGTRCHVGGLGGVWGRYASQRGHGHWRWRYGRWPDAGNRRDKAGMHTWAGQCRQNEQKRSRGPEDCTWREKCCSITASTHTRQNTETGGTDIAATTKTRRPTATVSSGPLLLVTYVPTSPYGAI